MKSCIRFNFLLKNIKEQFFSIVTLGIFWFKFSSTSFSLLFLLSDIMKIIVKTWKRAHRLYCLFVTTHAQGSTSETMHAEPKNQWKTINKEREQEVYQRYVTNSTPATSIYSFIKHAQMSQDTWIPNNYFIFTNNNHYGKYIFYISLCF